MQRKATEIAVSDTCYYASMRAWKEIENIARSRFQFIFELSQ